MLSGAALRPALDVMQQLRQAHLHPKCNDLQHGEGDRLAPSFQVRDEGAVDSEIDGHAELGEMSFPTQLSQSSAQPALYVSWF